MSLRLCCYNIEWFNHLFNKNNTLKSGAEEQSRLNAIRDVLLRLDADFVGIVEAPNSSKDGSESTVTKLQAFVNFAGLRTTSAVTGFISGGTQEIAALFDPAKLGALHDPGSTLDKKTNPRFDGEFFFDTDDDRIKEVYKHYRPPLELQVTKLDNDATLSVIVAHTKSKGIFSSMDLVHWERESRRNRLKLFAESTWIRRRVDDRLDANRRVVVMGDFNDGPGMDYYERQYGRSAVELVMGDLFSPEKVLRNYAGRPKWGRYGWKPASARFRDRFTEDYVNVMIDHILVSSDVPVTGPDAHRIWNPFENDEAKPLKKELLKASDHFPITLDIEV